LIRAFRAITVYLYAAQEDKSTYPSICGLFSEDTRPFDVYSMISLIGLGIGTHAVNSRCKMYHTEDRAKIRLPFVRVLHQPQGIVPYGPTVRNQ